MPTSALVLRSAFLSLLLSFTASAGQAQKPATEKPAVETPATKAESSAPALSEVDAAVLAAAQQGDAAALAAALAAGGDLEAADPDGATPLLWAAGNGHLDAVRVLTEAGAALEGGTGIVWLNRDTGLYMSSPLVAAAAFGHLAVVQHLAEQGADLDQPGWDPAAEAFVGWTALQWAAALGHTPVVAYLAAQGADLELGFGVPTPPLALALQAGHTETAAALEAAGASQVRAEAHLPVAMGPDAATTGALTDVHPLNQDGSHFVTHTLDLATAVPFTVAVTSDAFDPMLVAVSPSGVASSNDDWLGDPTEARVVVEAGEAGGWQVLVWSYEAAQTGAFTVTHQTLTEAEARALQTQAADLARADSLGQAAVALAGDGRTAEAVVLAEEEVALRGDVQGGEHPGMATSLHNLAAIYADLQRYDEAEARYEQALSLYETHLGPDHPEVAGTLGNLGDLYHTTGRYTEAVPLLQRALAIAEMTAQGDSSDLAALDVARALGNLAVAYVSLGRLDEAASLHERALAIREERLGANDPARAASLSNLAAVRSEQGDDATARDLATQALAIYEASLGLGHPDAANALGNLASYHAALADYAEAEALHRRAGEALTAALGADHPDVARSVSNLAGTLDAQGRYAEAAPLYDRALAIAEAVLGPDHPETATALNNLAAFYRQQSRYAEAEPLYRRALAILDTTLGSGHPNVAVALGNLGALLQETGRHAEAESLYRRALAIYEAASGPAHPDVAVGATNLAGVLDQTGRFAEAEPLYGRALAIRMATFGEAHPAVAESESNLAAFYQSQGRYAEAEPLYLRALGTMEAAYGRAHPDVAVTLGNLAAFYQSRGRYAEAEVRFERALAVYEAALSPTHPDVATGLGNLASLYAEAGRTDDAVPLAERALAIREDALGPEHPDVALSLSNLGTLAVRQGDPETAAAYERRALAIREATYGPTHPDVGTSLNNLAVYVEALGDAEEAEALHRRALAAYEAAFGPAHPDVAVSLNNLADVLRGQGRTAEARPLAERALAVRTEALGEAHPLVALTLASLMDLDIAEGDLAAANIRLAQALAVEQRVIDDLLPYATEREQQAFLRTRLPVAVSVSAALQPDAPEEATATAFAHLLQRKALRLDVLAARLRATRQPAASDTATARLAQTVQALGQEIAQRTFAGPGALDADAYRIQLDTLRARRERAEDRLARASATALDRLGPVEGTQVAAQLRPGERLVEYVRFRPYDFAAASGAPVWGAPRYAAFVAGADAAPRLLDLGVASEIDSLVARFRTQVVAAGGMGLVQQRRARAALDATTAALHARLIAPLGVGDASSLRVAPDGALHTLPFGVLAEAGETTLGEQALVSTVTSGRDLLRPTSVWPAADTDTLVVFAAVDYEAVDYEALNDEVDSSAADADVAQLAGAEIGAQARAQRGGSFAPLPGTAREATALADLGPVRLLLGAEATEEQLLTLQAPTRLHIATHGFFLSDDDALTAMQGSRSGQLSGGSNESSAASESEVNPMLRSGLAMAGANRVGEDRAGVTDGIATAYELAGLDLQGTDLVVLSACETGLGEIEAGEGVLGLRRAFEAAGAETVVMSLWKVPDDATAVLMTAFYRALADGQGKAEALRMAAAAVRAEPRWAHPYWWAAFVLAGESG